MKIDGRCHCGTITYEAEIDPAAVGICHCTDCQTFSGSAFRVGVVARDRTFKLLTGTPKEYVKTAESGGKRAQGFCPECGTAIYSTSVGPEPRVYRLRFGSISQRNALTPSSQGWYRSAQHWVTTLDSIPKSEKQRGADPAR